MVRYGQLIGVQPGKLAEYSRYHAKVWPEILRKITECNIRNYSIYHKDGLLFAYFEYVGTDYDGGHGEDGRRSEDPGVVGHHEAHAEAAPDARGGRVVGRHAGSLSPGLMPEDTRGDEHDELPCEKLARMDAALHHREADRVPVSDFFWGSFLERWRRELGLPADTDIYRYYDLDWISHDPEHGPAHQGSSRSFEKTTRRSSCAPATKR